jgi:hypothetical protein
MPTLLLALFLVAHGAGHPLLAALPSRDAAQLPGAFWTRSWLLGSGPTAKRGIWLGSILTAVLFVLAALSLLGWLVPQEWARTLLVASASASLLVLLVFWFREFVLGILIDAALLALVVIANWNPAGI